MTHKFSIQDIFLFAIFALLFTALIGIFYPFFSVILWTSLLYISVSPLHKFFIAKISKNKKAFELKRHALAAGFSIGTLLLIVGPLSFIIFQIIHQLITTLTDLEVFLHENPTFFTDSLLVSSFLDFLRNLGFEGLQTFNLETLDIRASILLYIQQYSNNLFSWSTSIIGSASNFLLSLVFLVFILYFFFLDGSYLSSLFAKAIPINPIHMITLTKKFSETIKGLLSGYVLVALYQGIIAFVLMKIFSVQAALLFSVVLMFASFIPLFGAAIVWIPIGILMVFTGPAWKGILFLILAGFGISFLDNFLRPFFLKERIKVHPLLIFFAILGGIQIFGINGLILGPIVVILFFTVLDMLVNTDGKPTLLQQ